MRALAVTAALLLLGCAADPSDLRPPKTPAEWSEYHDLRAKVDPVVRRLWEANRDVCAASPAPCPRPVNINISSRIGAFAGPEALYFSSGLLEDLETPDEIALAVGHEWTHAILDHVRKGYGIKAETDADCVGAMMAARAGYDVRRAARMMDMVADIEAGQGVLKVASLLLGSIPEPADHPSASQRETNLDRIAARVDLYKARDHQLNRTHIEQVCGVRF